MANSWSTNNPPRPTKTQTVMENFEDDLPPEQDNVNVVDPIFGGGSYSTKFGDPYYRGTTMQENFESDSADKVDLNKL